MISLGQIGAGDETKDSKRIAILRAFIVILLVLPQHLNFGLSVEQLSQLLGQTIGDNRSKIGRNPKFKYCQGTSHGLMSDGAVSLISASNDTDESNHSPPRPEPLLDGIVASPFGIWGQLGTAIGNESIIGYC